MALHTRLLCIGALALSGCESTVTNGDSSTVEQFLIEEFPNAPDFVEQQFDLNDDGTIETLVLLTDAHWCGSGGCTLLVLTPQGDSFRVMSRTSTSRPPIVVLATHHYGWLDIGVTIGGGGTMPYRRAILQFDGQAYPANSTLAPALEADAPIVQVLFSDPDTSP